MSHLYLYSWLRSYHIFALVAYITQHLNRTMLPESHCTAQFYWNAEDNVMIYPHKHWYSKRGLDLGLTLAESHEFYWVALYLNKQWGIIRFEYSINHIFARYQFIWEFYTVGSQTGKRKMTRIWHYHVGGFRLTITLHVVWQLYLPVHSKGFSSTSNFSIKPSSALHSHVYEPSVFVHEAFLAQLLITATHISKSE